MTATRRVLFICTGNSCRSQMAEGWLSTLAGDTFAAGSAGIEAHGKNPVAIEVMREAGVDISGQESTRLTAGMLEAADYLVTVCGHADDNCPALPPGLAKEHWPLEDPARATGTQEEILIAFRQSRDDIHARVADLVQRLAVHG